MRSPRSSSPPGGRRYERPWLCTAPRRSQKIAPQICRTPKIIRGGSGSLDVPSPEELAAGGIGFFPMMASLDARARAEASPRRAPPSPERPQNSQDTPQPRLGSPASPRKSEVNAAGPRPMIWRCEAGSGATANPPPRKSGRKSGGEERSSVPGHVPSLVCTQPELPCQASWESAPRTCPPKHSWDLSVSTEDATPTARSASDLSEASTECRGGATGGLARLPSPTSENPREAAMRRKRESADRDMEALKLRNSQLGESAREIGLRLRQSHARSFHSPFAVMPEVRLEEPQHLCFETRPEEELPAESVLIYPNAWYTP
ncbi:unnamed protein product [Effrenium voratum]|uniref:Uncharacterized protein n=1 Tax=Effrenium voratum TaxID=2562239 RepID=A0AA36I0G6_9DINO|nr:unnamed protein product [Effrenium voratum]